MKLESKMMLWSDRRIAPGEEESFQPYMTPYLLPGDQVRGCVIVLPGGMPGTLHLKAHEGLADLIRKADKEGKLLAAICAAPTIYGEMGLLEGKNATCYPGMEDKLLGANWQEQPVVVDGNFVTSRGVGTAIAFALTLVTILKDEETAKSLANSIVYKW